MIPVPENTVQRDITPEESGFVEKLDSLGFDGATAYQSLKYLSDTIGMWTVHEPFKKQNGQSGDKIAFSIITVHPLDNRPAYIDSITAKVWKNGDRTRLDISKRYDRRDLPEGIFPEKKQMIKDIQKLEKAQQIGKQFQVDHTTLLAEQRKGMRSSQRF